MKTINADIAAELILELFKAKPWLNEPKIMTEDDYYAKDEAIIFLRHMAIHNANSFDGVSAPAQRIVSGFLLDLMGKFMRPEHLLHQKTWLIDDSKSLDEQALQIIAAEITDSPLLSQERH